MGYKTGQVPWNKGIKGVIQSPFKGKKRPNISDAKKGVKFSEEHLKHVIEATHKRKGTKNSKYIKSSNYKHNDNVFKKGSVPWNKGLKQTQETKDKVRATLKAKGIQPSKEAIDKAATINRDLVRTEEHCHNLSVALTGHKNSPEAKAKMKISHTGVPLSEKHREGLSNAGKKKFQDLSYRKERIIKMRKGAHVRPTIPEKKLGELLQEACPDEYKYTGNDTFMIGRRFPDYVNINGKKKVVEMFGDFWHKGQNTQDKIDEYASYGFGCLVIWESDLKHETKESLINRIKVFNNE